MRNHKGERDATSRSRDLSRGPQRRPQTEKSEENTIEKLSTQLDYDQNGTGDEVYAENRENTIEVNASPKRKTKYNVPLGPDQLKKDICKRLDSNFEWIMKRITKDSSDNPETKTKIKLFFNKSVYEVEESSQGQKKSEAEMKKVYKELKESFNLLYSPDMHDQQNRLRKIAGLNFYQDTIGIPDDHCKSVRGNKRSDMAGRSMKLKKEEPKSKTGNLIESKRFSTLNAGPNLTLEKAQEIILIKENTKGLAIPKSVKHINEPKKIHETLSNIDNYPKTTTNKGSHQKAASNVERKTEKPMTVSSTKTLATKQSNRRIGSLAGDQVSKLKNKSILKQAAQEDKVVEPHIPSIHRTISNYYTKKFAAANTKGSTEKKAYEMKETENMDPEASKARINGGISRSISSKQTKRGLGGSTDFQVASASLQESYYKFVLDLKDSNDKQVGPFLQSFIADMIKTMQDFTNRFPHGAQAPDRSVNLPAKDKKKKYTVIFDLDETLVHCSFDHVHANPLIPSKQASSNNTVQVIFDQKANLFIRPFAREIIKELAEDFEVLVFTSSNKDYAKEVVKRLDPKMEYISFLLHRDHCNIRNNVAIKDLRIIKNRSLDSMLIVDNCVGSFGNQVSNGIPILPFQGDRHDQELPLLAQYIRKITSAGNPVALNASAFGLDQIRFCKDAASYVASLSKNSRS